jgi:hypothetical protein
VSDELLTNTEIQRRLEAARERVKRARATEARLRRQLTVTDRKLAAQIKITLGAALLRAVEAEPRHVEALRRLLAPHVTRPTDRQCLAGTPFEMADTAPVTAPAPGAADEHGEA